MQPIIRAARGRQPVDLLLTNGRFVNVFSGEIQTGAIAIAEGRVVGFGDYPARAEHDLKGRYVAPGFIDAHVHIESAMAGVTGFARALAARGTTTVVADPHEIANVLGAAGIDYMLRSAADQPINVYYTLPSPPKHPAGHRCGKICDRPRVRLIGVAAAITTAARPGDTRRNFSPILSVPSQSAAFLQPAKIPQAQFPIGLFYELLRVVVSSRLLHPN